MLPRSAADRKTPGFHMAAKLRALFLEGPNPHAGAFLAR
jgi:hypothetical protein